MKKQIVFIGRWETSENLSGPQKVARELYISISKNKGDFRFITYFFKDIKGSTVLKRIIGSEIVSDKLKIYRFGVLRQLWHLIINKPRIIHIITFERFLLPVVLLRDLLFRNSKIVYSAHGLHFIEKSYLKNISFKDDLLEKILFTKTDIVVFLSNIQKRKAEKKINLNLKEIAIVPNGIDQNFIGCDNRSQQNQKLNVFTYYNSELKQVELFIKLLTDFITDDLELYIIGDISERELKSSKNIIFPGRIPYNKMGDFLCRMDIYINLSRFESFSLLALESMAKGVIPIVSSQAGISEYIENSVDGFTIIPGNENSICEIISLIKNNDINLLDIRERAIFKSKTFAYPNIINQFKELYN